MARLFSPARCLYFLKGIVATPDESKEIATLQFNGFTVLVRNSQLVGEAIEAADCWAGQKVAAYAKLPDAATYFAANSEEEQTVSAVFKGKETAEKK